MNRSGNGSLKLTDDCYRCLILFFPQTACMKWLFIKDIYFSICINNPPKSTTIWTDITVWVFCLWFIPFHMLTFLHFFPVSVLAECMRGFSNFLLFIAWFLPAKAVYVTNLLKCGHLPNKFYMERSLSQTNRKAVWLANSRGHPPFLISQMHNKFTIS